MATGFVCHELYMWHNTGNFAGPVPYGNPVQPGEHSENPETKRRFRNLLEVSGLNKELTNIVPREATDEEILRFHTREHLEKIRGQNEYLACDAGSYTPMGRGSFDIAKLATGGVIKAFDAVLTGSVQNAYALVRPPGHHALPDVAMGFCIFGNAAITALHGLDVHKLNRIAIVDWDVHHGNGTQAAFWEDPRVLTISIHQELCFPPDSGYMSEIGEGKGEGYNLNIPLPPGSGVGAYEAAYDRVILPALRAYKPEIIIVPSGFDAGAHDPLGRQMMTSTGYRNITEKLMALADDLCEGRIIMCHEGGYSAPTVPFFGLTVMETLSGISTGIEDPFSPLLDGLGGQALQPHQSGVIKQAERLLPKIK